MAGTNGSRAGSDLPTPTDPGRIRNVVLVGPPGSGKTTLVERLLHHTGAVDRMGRVEDGTTTSDSDQAEHRQQRSVGLAVCPIVHGGIKVNLVDTPGYADFVGELRAGLRAADCALFVVGANDGIDDATRMVWRECEAVGMPRAIVLAKLDNARADHDTSLDQAREAFGDKVMPLYLRTGDDVLAGLLSRRVFVHDGPVRTVVPPDDDQAAEIEEARGELIEAIIEESEDETLMDRYLGGEDIDFDTLVDDLETAVARGSFFPVLPVSAVTGVGVVEVLEIITNAFPSPAEHPLPAVTTPDGEPVDEVPTGPDGPLLAEVVKTTSDPYVGRISIVRVFSGTLRPDMPVHVSGHFADFFGEDRGHEDHDEDERIGPLSTPMGAQLQSVETCVAGDICAVARLSRAETGDTLSDPDRPLLMQPWEVPEPLLPIAIRARSRGDEDKLSEALRRLAAEDPTLRVDNDPETRQLVLWCMGEAHSDVALERLERRYGVTVEPIDLRVPLRETFVRSVTARGRLVKQSGGHGQFAICDIRVEPARPGAGITFVDEVVGGAVPRQFIPSVEKGVRAQLEQGVRAGYPVVDVTVTLHDGKAHSVDSSDMAFQVAGSMAIREAGADGAVALLEPFDAMEVEVADEHVGAVLGDLSARRARVLGTEMVGDGRTCIRADAPRVETTRYAIDLRSLGHGTGTFRRRFRGYEPMPEELASAHDGSGADES
jgi:elongation factor G